MEFFEPAWAGQAVSEKFVPIFKALYRRGELAADRILARMAYAYNVT